MAISKLLGLLLTPVLAFFIWYSGLLGNKQETGGLEARKPAAQMQVRVVVKPVVEMHDTKTFRSVGTGRAHNSVILHSPVAEEIVEVLFRGGERVKQGETLVRLDDRDEKLAVELAQVRLNEARVLLKRYDSAARGNAIAENEVVAARAAVDVAEVVLKQAQLALIQRTIQAPFQGTVGIPRVDPGDRVTPSTEIAPLDDQSRIQVDFEIPEILIDSIQDGMKVFARTPAFPNEQFAGTVEAINTRVDPLTRTIQLRTLIPNPQNRLKSGMSFEVSLDFTGATYPSIPEIALKWSREGSYVWVVREGKSQKIMARVIARSRGYVMVESELQDGEPVVVAGAERLRDGREVLTGQTKVQE